MKNVRIVDHATASVKVIDLPAEQIKEVSNEISTEIGRSGRVICGVDTIEVRGHRAVNRERLRRGVSIVLDRYRAPQPVPDWEGLREDTVQLQKTTATYRAVMDVGLPRLEEFENTVKELEFASEEAPIGSYLRVLAREASHRLMMMWAELDHEAGEAMLAVRPDDATAQRLLQPDYEHDPRLQRDFRAGRKAADVALKQFEAVRDHFQRPEPERTGNPVFAWPRPRFKFSEKNSDRHDAWNAGFRTRWHELRITEHDYLDPLVHGRPRGLGSVCAASRR